MTASDVPAVSSVEALGDGDGILNAEADPGFYLDLGGLPVRQQHIARAHRATGARSDGRAFTAARDGSNDGSDRGSRADLGSVGSGGTHGLLDERLGANADVLSIGRGQTHH